MLKCLVLNILHANDENMFNIGTKIQTRNRYNLSHINQLDCNSWEEKLRIYFTHFFRQKREKHYVFYSVVFLLNWHFRHLSGLPLGGAATSPILSIYTVLQCFLSILFIRGGIHVLLEQQQILTWQGQNVQM